MKIPAEVYQHYKEIDEAGRLKRPRGILEFERSKQIIERFLQDPKLKILDIGGATGVYSFWLASLGHEVTLVDPMENLLEIAKANKKSESLKHISIGDVRNLNDEENTYDLIICFGPFYHLTSFEERKKALQELHRVLKINGVVLIAGISKYVSFIQSGLYDGMLEQDEFKSIVEQDLIDGQHRNPIDNTTYFTTSIFMEPSELKKETLAAGFKEVDCIAIEGPGWMHKNLDDIVKDEDRLKELMNFISNIEKVESILGVSTHFMISATKSLMSNEYK